MCTQYAYYAAAFAMGCYCNMRALKLSNVDTIIVFKSMSPLVVSILEYSFLGRSLPSLRSVIALCVILSGAVSYMLHDQQYETQGIAAFTWCGLYLACICFLMTYGKYLVSDVKMETWTRVL